MTDRLPETPKKALPMTDEEIVRSYKQAASPAKQIGILAELNLCDRKQIAERLRANGCELPGYYYKKQKQEQKPEDLGLIYAGTAGATGGSGKHEDPALAPDPEGAAEVERVLHETAEIPYNTKDFEYIVPTMSIRHAAIDVIADILGGNPDPAVFKAQVSAIFRLVWTMEHMEDN